LNTTIGENLGQALINLRKDEEDLRLSADAICITQQDDVEKSWQMELMGDIFNTALLTYVWLRPTPGDHDESPAQALDMILEIGKSCKGHQVVGYVWPDNGLLSISTFILGK
jgi:hypothetical protein